MTFECLYSNIYVIHISLSIISVTVVYTTCHHSTPRLCHNQSQRNNRPGNARPHQPLRFQLEEGSGQVESSLASSNTQQSNLLS